MELLDVTLRLGQPDLLVVLAPSVGYPTPDKLSSLADRYTREPSWSAYALFDGAIPVGVVGLEMTSLGCGHIRHIAVIPEAQRSGLGRRLIDGIRERASLRELSAETDADAVRFYERCGFTVRSLGERYPGVERFRCWWVATLDQLSKVQHADVKRG